MADEQKTVMQTPLGESEAFLDFQQALSRAATVERSVLVVGERGSGKEIAATRLHYLSKRWQHNLITVNCAALPPSLIETELFGYEAGAFTGATKTRKGRFEEAEGGTLFLDEIGLIPLEVQEKILRVVEYGTFERVGSSKTHEVNVRIIGATNADLPKLCAEGKFKEDLLDRLSFEVLFLPPLRKRGDDIILLANYFAAKMALECQWKEMPVLSEGIKTKLMEYDWPGNVRELKNVIERAVYRSSNPVIESIILDPFENPFDPIDRRCLGGDVEKPQENEVPDYFEAPLDQFEAVRQKLDISFIKKALETCKGNQKEAAKALGLTYDQFRGLYRKYRENLS
ncbi:MAG: phage shock protein operon transcriptional activator [Sphaerochaetaceae bacterium]|nr:phage shock protein operon transcriptional activator [Sphaerochaetaceae bacterium]NLV83120.1 phage shock protein operon transcriptional activator [Spirochaetales bacterium]